MSFRVFIFIIHEFALIKKKSFSELLGDEENQRERERQNHNNGNSYCYESIGWKGYSAYILVGEMRWGEVETILNTLLLSGSGPRHWKGI